MTHVAQYSASLCRVCLSTSNKMEFCEFNEIYTFLKENKYPNRLRLEDKQKEKWTKGNFRRKCKPYLVESGQLKRQNKRKKAATVAQKEAVKNILKELHAAKEGGGHYGETAT